MDVCPDHHDQCLNVTGNNGSQRRPLHSQLRERTDAEDHQIVQNRISTHRHKAGQHRDKGLPGLFYICRVGLVHRKRDQSHHHDGQIFQSVLQCQVRGPVPHRIRQIQGDQCGTFRQEQKDRSACHQQRGIQLKPKGIHMSLMIAFSEILGTEDAGS